MSDRAYTYTEPVSGHLRLCVGVPRIAHGDCPIRYADGRIAYNFPERVPKFIKEKVRREMDKARAAGAPFWNDFIED